MRTKRRIRPILAAAVLLVGLCCASAAPADPGRASTTHALLINGGLSPKDNALSHLHHLQDMVDTLLARGVPRENIHVFSSDGESPKLDLVVRGSVDPRLWMVAGTPIGPPLRRADVTNTEWPEVELKPARLAELRKWFVEMNPRLKPGDTLLVFVTDHGTRNKTDPENGYISMWNESLSVLEFRALLGHLKPGTRIVNVMSQCYSGAFAQAMYPLHSSTPTGDVCGFYSATADRLAYGCYPEGRDKDRIGHAFRSIDGLARNETMDEAHLEVLTTDLTPDVPVRTSDLFLESLLAREAERREVDPQEFIDSLMRRAWEDRGRWEPEIRLLDRIGLVYGVFSPRSLSEFQTHIDSLLALSDELSAYTERWRVVSGDLRRENLTRFLKRNPEWRKDLDVKRLADLTSEGRKALVEDFLPELESDTRDQEEIWDRLHELRATHAEAQSAQFRIEVRLAALLRMRAILLRVAAKQLLQGTEPSPRSFDRATALAALDSLEECESTVIGELTAEAKPLEPERLPPFEEDVAIIERVLPSWLGIRFRPLTRRQLDHYGVEAGAVVVQQVFEESGAGQAGIRQGDLILGPPDRLFDEPVQIREWIMRSPRDEPLSLRLMRDGDPLEVQVTLGRYPTEVPRLPAPPSQGDEAPALPALSVISHEDDAALAELDGPHLLFFWATWCGPCKASLPELVAWSEATGVPILAVSDENPDKVRSFLDDWTDPFPELVVSDELRLSYVSYGVSGTPTFVLIDQSGVIEWRQTGYASGRGLGMKDWTWK